MNDNWGEAAKVGGVLMIMAGIFRALSGLIALFNQEWIAPDFTGYFFTDISAVAWWLLIIGAIVVAAGIGVLAGRTWARVVGVIAVGLAALSEMLLIPIYSVWAIMMVVFYVVIVIGLILWKPVKS